MVTTADPSRLRAAEGLYENASFAEAADAFREACREYEPRDTGLYFESLLGLGLCLDHLGEFDESSAIYRGVLENPAAGGEHKSIARRNLAYAAGVENFAGGEFAAAHACFAKALAVHTHDDDFRSDILMWLGACHTQLGQYAAAGETYTDLLASGGAHESVKRQASQRQAFAEGQLHFAARRYREARVKFEQILGHRGAGNEFRSGALLMLAHCCFQLSDFRQASRRYRQILKTRNASMEQKREAREWRRAVPGMFGRLWRVFARVG